MTDRLGSGVVTRSSRGPRELTAKPRSSWGFQSLDRHQVVTAGRGAHELLPEAWLELVQSPPQSQQSRVDCGVGRVAAKEAGFDQVARGGRFRALRQVEHQGRLLLRQMHLAAAELDRAAGRVELQAPEAIAPRPAGSAFDQASGE